MKSFDYFYGNEHEKYLFLQMPWLLIKHDLFKNLSDGAKILYSLLLNKTSLSLKNGWQDDQGRIYIIYTYDKIMEDLNCADNKVTKLLNDLKKFGLIKIVRRGLGKPNIIYVMKFSTEFSTELNYVPRKELAENNDSQNRENYEEEPNKKLENRMNSLNREKHDSGTVKSTIY